MRLAERYPSALVTGASSGLGRAFSAMLLAQGVRVWGTSRHPDRLGGFGGGFSPLALDLARPEEAEAAYRRASAAAGGFALVINNAGYGLFGEFGEVEWAAWQGQLEAMLVATPRLAHAAVAEFRARGRGCLVNVSSLAAEFPLPFMSGYNMAKAALSALSESLIIELAGTGITIVDFRPGDYRTAFNQVMQPSPLPPAGSRAGRAWRGLDAVFQSSPDPARAAADLRGALRRGRSGTVRSGSWFQARLAPLFARLLPRRLLRAALARYYGV